MVSTLAALCLHARKANGHTDDRPCTQKHLCGKHDKAGGADGGVVALQDYQRLLASQSVRRLNPAKLSESAALKTKLVDTIAFLESMAVKDSNEKDLFFKRLPATLPSLPLPVVQKKVSPSALLLI